MVIRESLVNLEEGASIQVEPSGRSNKVKKAIPVSDIDEASTNADPAVRPGQIRKLVSIIKRGDETTDGTTRQAIEILCFDVLVECHRHDCNYRYAAEFAEAYGLAISLGNTIPKLKDTGATEEQLKPLVDALRKIKIQNLDIAEKLDLIKDGAGRNSELVAKTSERLRARSK